MDEIEEKILKLVANHPNLSEKLNEISVQLKSNGLAFDTLVKLYAMQCAGKIKLMLTCLELSLTGSIDKSQFIKSEILIIEKLLNSGVIIEPLFFTEHTDVIKINGEKTKLFYNKLLKGQEIVLIERIDEAHDDLSNTRALVYLRSYLYTLLDSDANDNKSKSENSEVEPKNPHPKIFKNGYAWEMFLELKRLSVDKNPLADYSFIYFKMADKKLGAIHETVTHPIFIKFLNENCDTDISAKKLSFKDQIGKRKLYSTTLDKFKVNILSNP